MFYYVVFAAVVPAMVRIPARLSASELNHGTLIKCGAGLMMLQPVTTITGLTLGDYRTDGCSAGKW